jgi:hypothetical protein
MVARESSYVCVLLPKVAFIRINWQLSLQNKMTSLKLESLSNQNFAKTSKRKQKEK